MSAKSFCTMAVGASAKHLAALGVSSVLFLAALPAQAQQQPAPSAPTAPYGYGPMMWGWPGGSGWGWHPFMMVGPVFGLLVLVGIAAIFMWLVRWATHGHPFHGRGSAALDILEERFARGEIDKAEFEDRRKFLGR